MKVFSFSRRGNSRLTPFLFLRTNVKQILKISIVIPFVFLAVSCQTTGKPIKPMIFASAAMKGAERARAERLAPDLYRKAEVKYWAAKTQYLQKNFEAAEKNANEAKRLFEKSEVKAAMEALEDSNDD